jgi:hypothetical protein
MAKVTVSWHGGRSVAWEDGEVSGDGVLLLRMGWLARQGDPVPRTPEGPFLDPAGWKADPEVFIAVAGRAVPGEPEPRVVLDGVALASAGPEPGPGISG